MLMDRQTVAKSALPGRVNHSAECRQRFEKIQYDLLQEKLRQAPAIPEDSGEQTVVTPAPAASEAEPGLATSSSSPSARANPSKQA